VIPELAQFNGTGPAPAASVLPAHRGVHQAGPGGVPRLPSDRPADYYSLRGMESVDPMTFLDRSIDRAQRAWDGLAKDFGKQPKQSGSQRSTGSRVCVCTPPRTEGCEQLTIDRRSWRRRRGAS
jgi:hypothetical protein